MTLSKAVMFDEKKSDNVQNEKEKTPMERHGVRLSLGRPSKGRTKTKRGHRIVDEFGRRPGNRAATQNALLHVFRTSNLPLKTGVRGGVHVKREYEN